MKFTAALLVTVAFSVSSLAYAQTDSMKDMDMKDMDNKPCMDMMDKKDMDSKKCMDMMKNMNPKTKGKAAKKATHEAVAVVKNVDGGSGKVTLAHEPIKSLNWPAMTKIGRASCRERV